MNPKYINDSIVTRRDEECNLVKVYEHIDRIFEIITIMDGCQHEGCEWI